MLQLLHGHHPVTVTTPADTAALEPESLRPLLLTFSLVWAPVHASHLRPLLHLVAWLLRPDVSVWTHLVEPGEFAVLRILVLRVMVAVPHGLSFEHLQWGKTPFVRLDAPVSSSLVVTALLLWVPVQLYPPHEAG